MPKTPTTTHIIPAKEPTNPAKDHSILTKKGTPKTTKEVMGQDSAILQLRNFVVEYNNKKQKKKGMLLYGPPGSGKTCSVHALANELGHEILEINASDCRNAESLNTIIGSAIKQRSLFFRNKIILVDELDGISGTEDRGGTTALANIITDTAFPIIITANDPFDKKFSTIRTKCAMVEFNPLDHGTVFSVLKNMCVKEKIMHDEESLKTLARRSGGDARGALTDLQTLSALGKISKKEVELLNDREREEAIENALLKIFKTTDEKIALQSLDYVNEDTDECFLWLEENIPYEYTKQEDIANAFDALSKADVLRGRIRKMQHWRFLAYISEYLTAGIALAKKEKYKKTTKYERTKRILAIWMASQKNKRKKDIAAKIAEKTHTSTKRALKDVLPYLSIIFKKNRKKAAKIAEELGLDEEDIGFLVR